MGNVIVVGDTGDAEGMKVENPMADPEAPPVPGPTRVEPGQLKRKRGKSLPSSGIEYVNRTARPRVRRASAEIEFDDQDDDAEPLLGVNPLEAWSTAEEAVSQARRRRVSFKSSIAISSLSKSTPQLSAHAQALYDLIRFPADWSGINDKAFRLQLIGGGQHRDAIRYRDMYKEFDLDATGRRDTWPLKPRKCLFQVVTHAGNAIQESGKWKRSDCAMCSERDVAERVCVFLTYAEGVRDPAGPRDKHGRCILSSQENTIPDTDCAKDGKRWVLGMREGRQ